MAHHRNLDALHAAELVAFDVNEIIDTTPHLLDVDQLRRSAQSIGSNIREGFGRGPGKDRAHYLRMSRGSAEETIGHLRSNFRADRIPEKTYWRQHNRIATITKMLNSLLRGPGCRPPVPKPKKKPSRARKRRKAE